MLKVVEKGALKEASRVSVSNSKFRKHLGSEIGRCNVPARYMTQAWRLVVWVRHSVAPA